MIKEAIVKIVGKQDLTYDEAYAVMNEIMSGKTTLTQNAAFLAALSTKSAKAEVERALASGAAIIGVNNRNLKDFTVDTANSRRLRSLLPPEVRFVSESGVRTPEDVQALRKIGADAVLVGEALMRAPDKASMLARLKGAPV